MAQTLPIEKLSVKQERQDSETDSEKNSGFHTPPTEQTSITEPSEKSNVASTALSSADELDKLKGPIRTPISTPLSTSKPIERPALTKEQITKYNDLLTLVKSWEAIPASAAKGGPTAPLTDNEKLWLTRECLLRYLRASSWSLVEAQKRLMNTIIWRRDFNVETISADHVSEESVTGKQHILGYDNNARPCLFMNPGRQNTKKSERQIEHVVYMLERVIDMTPVGQETTAILINFKNTSTSGSPSIAQGKHVLNILQSHYPERLGRACIADLPWYITTFFKLISPLIDPVTKEKMIFNQDLRKHVPPAQLDKEYGGDADFEYVHEIYWPALAKMCAERRAAQKERWIAGGKHVGEYESYLKGGEQQSLQQQANDPTVREGVIPVAVAAQHE